LMHVAEGLLLWDEFDVVAARVCDEFSNLFGRERAAFGRDEQVRGRLEDVLYVEAVHVEFEHGLCAKLTLDVLDGRDGAAAYVVGDRAPAHRGPVGYLRALNESRVAVAADELLQGLQA